MEFEGYHSESGPDSDEELQEAFRTGKLQPGINIIKERPVKTFVNKEKEMLAKLEDFRSKLPWLERLDLVNVPARLAPELKRDLAGVDRGPCDRVVRCNQLHPADRLVSHQRQEQMLGDQTDDALAEDDFKREAMFYRQAQAAVLEGLPRLQALDVPTRRPDDYLAQMVKSDEQMDKVRKFLIRHKTQKEMSEKARKLRELKKMGKKTQIEAQQRKAKEKREMLEKVKKFRKGKEKSLDFLDGHGDEETKPNQRGPRQGNKPNKRPISRKREEKNARFGFGGRKRGHKRNTAESTSDTSWVHGKGRKGKKYVTKTGGKGNPNKRPGKQARQSMKSKNKKK